MIGSLVGVTVFLVLLLFAVHLVLNLYATSVVTAVSFDAARLVAGADGGAAAESDAAALVGQVLDRYEDGGRLELSWRYEDRDGDGAADVVHLDVVAEHPNRLLPNLRLPYQRVARTITVRMERLR